MEVTREMIYQEALRLQEAIASLRVEVAALEVIMERIEAIGPCQVHEYEIGGVMDAQPRPVHGEKINIK
ncbi:hypothetical protein [Caballeronia arationis]|uniref:hypothetical protein n=1 Tax=Caballeronia arationis TaxID=1777142 RepID=UPI0011982ABD|nr:hypothetical protein [Caballeronia arationis]